MTIQCDNIEEMVKVCAELAREGVTFKASTFDYSVTLTGGF